MSSSVLLNKGMFHNFKRQHQVLIILFWNCFLFFFESFDDVSQNDQVDDKNCRYSTTELMKGRFQLKMIQQDLFDNEKHSNWNCEHQRTKKKLE